jgi:hypothetical protein
VSGRFTCHPPPPAGRRFCSSLPVHLQPRCPPRLPEESRPRVPPRHPRTWEDRPSHVTLAYLVTIALYQRRCKLRLGSPRNLLAVIFSILITTAATSSKLGPRNSNDGGQAVVVEPAATITCRLFLLCSVLARDADGPGLVVDHVIVTARGTGNFLACGRDIPSAAYTRASTDSSSSWHHLIRLEPSHLFISCMMMIRRLP